MCIICVKKKGVNPPTEETIRTMFDHNPDGAGYMFVNDGTVEIHKGFMNVEDFLRDVKEFTEDDVVIYHFRISTQAGVKPSMTHPFPLTDNLEDTELLDLRCACGIAHNGRIPCTSGISKDYSDTALFVANYLSEIMYKGYDSIENPYIYDAVDRLADSKLAFMNGKGEITLIGDFIKDENGLIYSNRSYEEYYYKNYKNFSKFFLDESRAF